MDTPHSAKSAEPIWLPDESAAACSRIAQFTDFVARRTGTAHTDYQSLWAWPVGDLPGFWTAVSEFFDVRITGTWDRALDDAPMPVTRWFPGGRLNYAEHALRTDDPTGTALISVDESGTTQHITWAELHDQVGALTAWLRRRRVKDGDRVVGYLPDSHHAVVAFPASAAIGAVWSACGQGYGAEGATTRFAQHEPALVFAADGYRWNGRRHDRRADSAAPRCAPRFRPSPSPCRCRTSACLSPRTCPRRAGRTSSLSCHRPVTTGA